MSLSKHSINWFEIPVTDFQRAERFYSQILGEKIQPFEMGTLQMGFFPAAKGSVSGALVCGNGATPSDKGSLVYLNAGNKLAEIVERIGLAGGSVVQGVTSIGEYGTMAKFRDTEGNVVALHSDAQL